MKKTIIASVIFGFITSISSVFITFIIGIGTFLPLTIAVDLLLYIVSGFAFGFFIGKSKWWHFLIAGSILYLFYFLMLLVPFVYISLVSSRNVHFVSVEIFLYALIPVAIYISAGLAGNKFRGA